MNYDAIKDIVQQAKEGKREAIDLLYQETYHDVYSYAYNILKNDNDASDVVQDVYLKIHGNISSLEDVQAFPKWLYTITMNECRQKMRKEKRQILTGEGDSFFEQFFDPEPELYVQMAQQDVKDYIFTILDLLPESQKRAVLLYYYDQLTISEIAEREGVPKGTIKSRLHLARKKLQKAVEAEERRTSMKL